jgi:hypothetical protein
LRLARAAVAVRVREGVDRGFAGRTDELALGAAATFGLVQELLVLAVRGHAALHP